MRKKFLAMYALAGALVASPIFTSCIDDTESESVTAVRKEAAEKLRIANEIAQATKDLQIQSEKLYYEQNIANYQAKLLEYQLNLKKNQDALDAYGIKNLSDLTYAYTTALNYVANSELEVLKLNNHLKVLKDGYVDAEKVLAESIEDKNAEIATYQAKIDQLNEWIENGAIDKVELQNKIDELTETQSKLHNDYELLKLQYGSLNIEKKPYTDDAGNTWYAYDGETKLAAIEAARKLKEFETDNAAYFVDENGNPYSFFHYHPDGYYILNETTVEYYKQNYDNEEYVKNLKAILGTEADTEETTVSEESTDLTLYAQLAVANKALAEAEKALAENEDDTQTTTLEEAVKDAKMTVAAAKDEINIQLMYIASSENTEDYIAAFNEGFEEYKTAKAALDKAYEDWSSANNEENALNNLYLNIKESSVYVDSKELTLAEAVEYYEAEIEAIKEDIAELKIDYNDNGINVDSEEVLATLVAYYENQLAAEEYKLAAYKKAAEEAKAALDAYLGTSDDTATEEA